MTDYEDIKYEIDGPTAVITINRPQRHNAFRGKTVEELIGAFRSVPTPGQQPKPPTIRSLTNSHSNLASEPKMWKTNRPPGVVVSMDGEPPEPHSPALQLLRALGDLLQERVCFSHDQQSCLGPAHAALGRIQLSTKAGKLGLLSGETPDLGAGRPTRPGHPHRAARATR